MKIKLLQRRDFRILLGLVLVIMTILFTNVNTYSQIKPNIPVLSLTGANNNWDESWYPDGRIWMPASLNEPREFLMPVFIDNRWHIYEETKDIYQPDPIKSFQFTIMYDSSALRVVGVQKFGPRDEQLGYEPLAKTFNISWMDVKNFSYRKYLNPFQPEQDTKKGRAIRIVGTSTQPLPVTNLDGEEFKVLLYIRFKIIPKDGEAFGTSGNTPIYIKNDTIKYNDMNVCKDAPFAKLRPYYPWVINDYPDPNPYTGLAGVKNGDPYDPSQNTAKWPVEPMLPGTIYLRLSDRIPVIAYTLDRAIGTQPPISELGADLWNLSDPITIDSGSFTPIYGRRVFQLRNGITTSRLLDVTLESDKPWLKFRALNLGPTSKVPSGFGGPITKGTINWLDNGILGNDQIGTPIAGKLTKPDGDVWIEIRCDPQGLEPSEGEMAGIYIGYITIKSHTAYVSPIRLRVTFIHFRVPYEPELYNATGNHNGIRLTVRNSSGATGFTSNLIFGTGHRATIGVDSLFGEYAYEYGFTPGKFEARFFPPDEAPDDIKLAVANGFGDFAPDDDDNDGSPKRSNSRDIRDINDTLTSLVYKVRINEDTAANYPIIIEWDLNDFPEGAQLFLRDTLNGALFPSIDMRKATVIGTSKRAYAIQDPRVKSFLIEYTLPRVINYVDEYGNPIIKKGWNLLSLPVRPINSKWDVFYPNAINIPYFFSQNQYQQPDAGILKVGVGYYIKYDAEVDKQFAGTFINDISNPRDPVRVYPGWNTIGAASATVNVREISFTNFNLELPTVNYTRTFGIWGYRTDRGFYEASELKPGLGYWIKVNANGYYRLVLGQRAIDVEAEINPKQEVIKKSDMLLIKDNEQSQSQVYFANNSDIDVNVFELPPVPPANLFDLRFADGKYLTTQNESVIQLQGVTYPLTLTIDNPSARYTFYDAATGEYLGTIYEGSKAGNIEVKSEKSNAIKVLRSVVATEGFSAVAYPNPIADKGTVAYNLPENGNVQISLFDVLGNEVQNLFNGFATAGYHTLDINAANLASGRYILKVTAGGQSLIQTVTIVK